MSPAPTCLAPATRAQGIKAWIQASSKFKALSRRSSIMSQEQMGRIPYYFYYQPTSRTRRELGHPHTAKGRKGYSTHFRSMPDPSTSNRTSLTAEGKEQCPSHSHRHKTHKSQFRGNGSKLHGTIHRSNPYIFPHTRIYKIIDSGF